ncbi:MAG: GrpB family protein [Negativicutes bacterium]|nr:GrpB family protein [Negativicutes bacterium]
MHKKKVIVLPYDPNWPNEFAKIKSELAAALPLPNLEIEHVGSTSGPGLAAKPVIDLDLIMGDDLFGEIKQRLLAVFYIHEGELGIPDREAFQ